jgi:DNA-binding NarL/FixJ family response regulator
MNKGLGGLMRLTKTLRRCVTPRPPRRSDGRAARVSMPKACVYAKMQCAADLRVTCRQAEILDLAARDLAVKQIAGHLGLSVSTVRTQLQRFYKANALHSRAGAVALWLRSRRVRS